MKKSRRYNFTSWLEQKQNWEGTEHEFKIKLVQTSRNVKWEQPVRIWDLKKNLVDMNDFKELGTDI